MKIYLVGGAVRDTYLKKPASDRDYVVVGGRHDKMLDLGYVQVGASFPVYLHPDTGEEYALARQERKVGEGYHGFETTTDNVTIEEDLSRRDFTINAMAIDMDTADLVDPHGGFRDLKAKVIRHVGPAFSEDPLRVVRMARFAGKLREDGFTVADETFFMALEMVRIGALNELPWERFAAEIHKALNTCTPEGCYTFFDVLHRLQCSKHVSFFAGQDLQRIAQVAKKVNSDVVAYHRAELLAVCGFNEAERVEHIGGAVARDVWLLLEDVQQRGRSIESLYAVLKHSGAWNESATFSLLVAALQLKEAMGDHTPFSSTLVQTAKIVTAPMASIGSELARQGVKGSAIGAAIQTARMEALKSLDLANW